MHVVFVDSNMVGLNALLAAKRAGHSTTFIGSRRFAAMIGGVERLRKGDLADHVIEIESALDEAELSRTLDAIYADRPIDVLLTVLDFCALPVARCAARLGLAGADPTAVALAKDKAACRGHIASHGIRSVGYAVVGDLEAARREVVGLSYPIIAKPNKGALSLHARRIGSDVELAAYFETLALPNAIPSGVAEALSREILLESYVDGPLFSVEVACALGEAAAIMVSARKRCADNPSIELGTTMPAPVAPGTARSLTEYALAVTRSLGLDLGIFHIEIVLGPEGPVLIEVNPRIMGGNMPTVFRLATGVDAYELLLSIHADRRLPDFCRSPQVRRAASTRMIGPIMASVVNRSLEEGWCDRLVSRAAAWNFDVRAGTRLDAMESSMCPHSFQLVGDTPVETSLLAEWMVDRIANATEVDLRRSSEDYLLS